MIWIGTSGFQYPEWKKKFYPAEIPAAKMLAYYAGKFPTTEINYTFRRIPSEKTMANWRAQTPASFRFALKAPQRITHFQKLSGSADALTAFWATAQSLGRKLGPVLFQLPPFLKKDLPRLEDFLALLPKRMKAAFEFRHESWFDDQVFDALKSRGAALCIADSEKLTTPVAVTSGFVYFRLRDQYSPRELKRWAATISKYRKTKKEIFVYFKHEETGSGPRLAAKLMELLGED